MGVHLNHGLRCDPPVATIRDPFGVLHDWEILTTVDTNPVAWVMSDPSL